MDDLTGVVWELGSLPVWMGANFRGLSTGEKGVLKLENVGSS
jgi:hypothetical protein